MGCSVGGTLGTFSRCRQRLWHRDVSGLKVGYFVIVVEELPDGLHCLILIPVGPAASQEFVDIPGILF